MRFTQISGRVAGVLYLLTSIVGFFAWAMCPGTSSWTATHATAGNIAAHQTLFRLGIAGELIGQAGFIFVALALYELLKGVNRRQASLMAILIVLPVPIAFLNELNALAALVLVRGADFLSVFDKPQRDGLAMLFINLHAQGFAVADCSGACGSFRSRCWCTGLDSCPGFSVLAGIAGVAWVMLSFTGILLPQYQDQLYTLSQPAFFGEIAFMLWLLIKGARPAGDGALATD